MVAGFKSNLLVNETETWADAINIKAELEATKPFTILMNKLERLSLLAPFLQGRVWELTLTVERAC